MYAIVEIKGEQFKVVQDMHIYSPLINDEPGTSIDLDKVILVESEGGILVGNPVVEGAIVKSKIVGHVRADKVIVFKKKRRKGYKKLQGHRQRYTKLLIESISLSSTENQSNIK